MTLKKRIQALFAFLMPVILCCTSAKSQNVDSISRIDIEVVDFDIETFARVECDEFGSVFKNEIRRISLYKDADTETFSAIIAKLQVDETYSPDTRAVVTVYYNTHKADILCLDNNTVSLNGKMAKPSEGVVNFVKGIKP